MATPNETFISNLEKYRSKSTGNFGVWEHSDRVGDLGSGYQQAYRRSEMLAEHGYVEATSYFRRGTVSGTDQEEREKAWDLYRASAEHNINGAEYRLMPDDWNPGDSGGNSLAGSRLGHRMQYGATRVVTDTAGNPVLSPDGRLTHERFGPQVRVLSATSIKSFARHAASEGDRTVSIPVEYDDGSGNTVIGHVAVSQVGKNEWAATALNIPGDSGRDAADRIGALLEGRRVSTALNDENVIEKRRARLAGQHGAQMNEVSASWFKTATIFSTGDGGAVLAVKSREPLKGTGKHGVYGYKMSMVAARAIRDSEHGASALAKVKSFAKASGEDISIDVHECENCGRIKSRVQVHRCKATAQRSTKDHVDNMASEIAVRDGKSAARRFMGKFGQDRARRRD